MKTVIPRVDTDPHSLEPLTPLAGRWQAVGVTPGFRRTPSGWGLTPGSETLLGIYNSNKPGMTRDIPRVGTAPPGVETLTPGTLFVG